MGARPVRVYRNNSSRFGVAFLAGTVLFSPHSAADKISGSNLPSSQPTLKGRIGEDGGPTSVLVLSTGGGATTNAGPTLLEAPSVFLDRSAGYAHVARLAAGRLELSADVSERRYDAFEDADEVSGQASVSLTRDWAGQQTILAFAASSGRDIEERLRDVGIAVSHAWTEGPAKPYVKANMALLDFRDLPEILEPIRNQDDRDRISSRVQVGLRATLTEHVSVEIGAGIDTKHYLDQTDDFGLQRDSTSPFAVIGVAWSGAHGSLRATYMPFQRRFREALFLDAWKHGYSVEVDLRVSDAIKAFASARYGFEETDFLVASSAYESVAVAGVTLTLPGGTVSLAASQTWRDYDGLDLVDLERADRKFEVAVAGEMPLRDDLSLQGRITYMDYASSLGEVTTDVTTDALTAVLGVTYTLAQ